METKKIIPLELSSRLRNEHKERVPVVFVRKGKYTPELSQYDFLVKKTNKMSQVIDMTIRKHSKLNSKQAVFLFTKRFMIPLNETLESIDNQYRSLDGFLYIEYTIENTFG